MKNYPKLGKPLAVGYLADITGPLSSGHSVPDPLHAQVSPGPCGRSTGHVAVAERFPQRSAVVVATWLGGHACGMTLGW